MPCSWLDAVAHIDSVIGGVCFDRMHQPPGALELSMSIISIILLLEALHSIQFALEFNVRSESGICRRLDIEGTVISYAGKYPAPNESLVGMGPQVRVLLVARKP